MMIIRNNLSKMYSVLSKKRTNFESVTANNINKVLTRPME